MFGTAGKRICLFQLFVCMMTIDSVFVAMAFTGIGYEALPNAGGVPAYLQVVFSSVPVIEVPNDLNGSGSRGINGKVYSSLSVYFRRMCAEVFIKTVMLSLFKEVNIVVSKSGISSDSVGHHNAFCFHLVGGLNHTLPGH